MESKFQCKDCGIVFDADDSMIVNCPSCGSDNITLVKPKSKLPKYIALGMSALVLAAGIAFLTKYLKSYNAASEPPAVVEPEQPGAESEAGDDISRMSDNIELGLAPLKISKFVTPDAKTKTYSFAVSPTKTIPGYSYKYQLIDFATGKQVCEQATGEFSGVTPASDVEGSYIVKAFAYDKSGKQVEDAALEITGCVKFPEAEIQKRTISQVQSDISQMIKAQSSQNITASGAYARRIRFTCSDGESISSFGDILQQINFGIWSSVNVSAVGYDSDNRVNSISLNVQ